MNAAPDASGNEDSAAWDRIGQFLQNTGTLGERMIARNLDLWSSVRAHLNQGPYTADAMASDMAKAMVALQENVEDAWSVLVTPPERERYVQALPTAFLFFNREDRTTHTLLDPVFIPVSLSDDHELPVTAEIALDGTSSETVEPSTAAASQDRSEAGDNSSRKGVEALLKRLVARLDGKRRYRLETVGGGDEAEDLVAGVYDGLVYLKNPALPLANVRVVVEGPPPSV